MSKVHLQSDLRLQVPEQAYQGQSLVDTLEFHAERAPGRIAFNFIDYAGELPVDRPISCAQLLVRARQVAGLLQGSGKPGDRVLLLYPSGLDYLVAFFGCLYAGMVAVPSYPPINPRLRNRLAAVTQDCGARIALTTSEIVRGLGDPAELSAPLAALRWLPTDTDLNGLEYGAVRPVLNPQSLAFLQYTSGSTGTPKGVMVTHGNLLNNLRLIAVHMQFCAADRHLSWLPPFHDMGMIGAMLGTFAAGVQLDFMMPTAFLRRPERWLREISNRAITQSGAPNFAYELCLSKVGDAVIEQLDLSNWVLAYSGAEPIRQETLTRFAERFAPCGFDPKAFFPCYGMAETTLYVTGAMRGQGARPFLLDSDVYAIERRATPALEGAPARTVISCGEPAHGHQVVIIDPASLQPLEDGAVGEVLISGPSVTAGYWQRETETVATYGARVAGHAGNFLRTGDLGFLHEGELYISGRVKDLIIVRGVNLYPHDIEASVDYCPRVTRPGCGIAFAIDAEGGERLVFAQEIGKADIEHADAICSAIQKCIVEQHEVQPYAIVLIESGSIPKTTSGKLSRSPCRQAYLNGSLQQLASWTNPIYHSTRPVPTLDSAN